MILLFMDNMTKGKPSLELFICNVASIVAVIDSTRVGGLATGLAAIAKFSDFVQSFDHYKSSSIWYLIKDKLRDLQKLFE